MFRQLSILLITMLLLPICAQAFTAEDLAKLGERDLVKIGERRFVQAAEVQSCGPYLFLAKPCRSDGSLILVRIKIGGSDPTDMLPYFFFHPDQVRVIIDNGLRAPRAKIKFRGLEPEDIVIRISEADLGTAPCLPQPAH